MQVVLSRDTGACTEMDSYSGFTLRAVWPVKSLLCTLMKAPQQRIIEYLCFCRRCLLFLGSCCICLRKPNHTALFRSCVIYTHSTMGLYKDSTSLRVFWSARVASASHGHWAILVSTLMVNRSCLQCLNSDVPDWLMLPCPSLSAFTAAHAAYHTNSDFILWSYAIMHCVCTF